MTKTADKAPEVWVRIREDKDIDGLGYESWFRISLVTDGDRVVSVREMYLTFFKKTRVRRAAKRLLKDLDQRILHSVVN